MKKKTDWFDGNRQPLRAGVYQRKMPCGIFYSLWDGVWWYVGSYHQKYAARSTVISRHQSRPWRGLAQDPILQSVLKKAASLPW